MDDPNSHTDIAPSDMNIQYVTDIHTHYKEHLKSHLSNMNMNGKAHIQKYLLVQSK